MLFACCWGVVDLFGELCSPVMIFIVVAASLICRAGNIVNFYKYTWYTAAVRSSIFSEVPPPPLGILASFGRLGWSPLRVTLVRFFFLLVASPLFQIRITARNTSQQTILPVVPVLNRYLTVVLVQISASTSTSLHLAPASLSSTGGCCHSS